MPLARRPCWVGLGCSELLGWGRARTSRKTKATASILQLTGRPSGCRGLKGALGACEAGVLVPVLTVRTVEMGDCRKLCPSFCNVCSDIRALSCGLAPSQAVERMQRENTQGLPWAVGSAG